MSHDWPEDLSNAVFLGRALNSVGTALFGTSWTGKEAEVESHMSTRRVKADWSEHHRAHELLHRHRPERGLPPPPNFPTTWPPKLIRVAQSLSGNSSSEPPFELSDGDILEAQRVIDELNMIAKPSMERFSKAWHELVHAAKKSELKAMYLHSPSSELLEIPISWWVGHLRFRHLSMMINPSRPSGSLRISQNEDMLCWVYVERQGLKALLGKIHPSTLQ